MLTERVRLRLSARSAAALSVSRGCCRTAWDLTFAILPARVSALISIAMRRSSGYTRLRHAGGTSTSCESTYQSKHKTVTGLKGTGDEC